jgi:hypothetical protein
MDYAHFMGCSFLGGGPALAIFFLLRAKRRAWIPPLGWWLSLILGALICFYAMSHSTMPSFSTRITTVGKAYDYMERDIHTGRHHDTIYGFRFVPEGGEPINIETEISLPDTAYPPIFDGRTFRIVYLADSKRIWKNEAVDIEILSGENTGFHDSLDARPAGVWLGIPVGAAFFGFGLAGLGYMKKDAISAASDDDETPSISDNQN